MQENIIGLLFKLERPGNFGISFVVLPPWGPELCTFKVGACVDFISIKSLKGKNFLFHANFLTADVKLPDFFQNFFCSLTQSIYSRELMVKIL